MSHQIYQGKEVGEKTIIVAEMDVNVTWMIVLISERLQGGGGSAPCKEFCLDAQMERALDKSSGKEAKNTHSVSCPGSEEHGYEDEEFYNETLQGNHSSSTWPERGSAQDEHESRVTATVEVDFIGGQKIMPDKGRDMKGEGEGRVRESCLGIMDVRSPLVNA